MNIDLTTTNLRSLCRLCLNKGDINLWEHYVTVPEFSEGNDCEGYTEIQAIEIFKIFQNYDNALLSLNEELKLLCCSCLDELSNSYSFYLKAIHSNSYIQKLYEEALKIEQSTEATVDVLDSEHSNFGALALIHTSEDEIEENKTDIEYFNDFIEPEELITYTQSEESSENKVDLQPTFETELPFNNSPSDFEEIKPCDNDDTIDEIVKSDRMTFDFKPNEEVPRSTGPTLPPHEDGSLVVTQFLPATAHIVLDNAIMPDTLQEDEGGGGGSGLYASGSIIAPVPDMSTVEYAAVEIKSSNFRQIVEEELNSQNPKPSSPQNMEDDDEQLQSSNTVFVCKYCPQAFAASHYLIAHIRKCHVCKYCMQAFVKSMDLFIHIRQAHHQHKCAICNKELSSHSNLRAHIKRVHGIRLPAQVALLDYKPPSNKTMDEKQQKNNEKGGDTLEDMDIYF